MNSVSAVTFALSCLMILAGCDEGAPARTTPTSEPPAFLGGIETRILRASATGREYQVSVAVPLGYDASTENYSVLVGVDANGQFGILVETARILRLGRQIPPLIVVGIGFPVGGYQTLSRPRRLFELTPTEIEGYVELLAASFPDIPPPEGSGGAPELLHFIVDDAMPFVDSNYRTEASGRTLYGHSAGGSFALYGLLRSAGAFSRFLIASPALWWDDRAAFRQEAAYAESREDLPAKAFFSVGLGESDELAPPVKSGRMVSNLRDYLEVLDQRDYQDFTWNAHFFEGENHQSVVGPSISRGLRYLYQD